MKVKEKEARNRCGQVVTTELTVCTKNIFQFLISTLILLDLKCKMEHSVHVHVGELTLSWTCIASYLPLVYTYLPWDLSLQFHRYRVHIV